MSDKMTLRIELAQLTQVFLSRKGIQVVPMKRGKVASGSGRQTKWIAPGNPRAKRWALS